MCRPLFFAFGILACVTQLAVAEFRYDDGERHVLKPDGPIEPPITVTNGSHLDMMATVIAPESLDSAALSISHSSATIEQSVIDLTQTGLQPMIGLIESAEVLMHQVNIRGEQGDGNRMVVDGSKIEVVNGNFENAGFSLRQGSEMRVSDFSISHGVSTPIFLIDSHLHVAGPALINGTVEFIDLPGVLARGTSSVQISNGDVEYPVFEDQATLTMNGGQISAINDDDFGVRFRNESAAYLSEGAIIRMFATHDSEIVMMGGEIRKGRPALDLPPVSLNQNAMMNIAGGMLTCEEDPFSEDPCVSIQTADTSFLSVVGSDFNYPEFEPINDLEGTITGKLADGSRFSWVFEREPNATIILIPEPTSITLSIVGFLGLMGCRRNRNAA